jgi:hypothetical protein
MISSISGGNTFDVTRRTSTALAGHSPVKVTVPETPWVICVLSGGVGSSLPVPLSQPRNTVSNTVAAITKKLTFMVLSPWLMFNIFRFILENMNYL